MAHDGGMKRTVQVPPTCPKCGSHRTQVVGRSNDDFTVRCGDCAERSVEVIAEDAAGFGSS